MKTFGRRLPACRRCGFRADKVTNAVGNGAPATGDPNLCINCGELSIFEDGSAGVALRPATEEDIAKMPRRQIEDIERMRSEIAKSREGRPHVTNVKETDEGVEIEVDMPERDAHEFEVEAKRLGMTMEEYLNSGISIGLNKLMRDGNGAALDPRVAGLSAAAGMDTYGTGGIAGKTISDSLERDREAMRAAELRRTWGGRPLDRDPMLSRMEARSRFADQEDKVMDAVVGLGLAQGAVARDHAATDMETMRSISADLGAAVGRADVRGPAPASVRAAREAMAQNLAANEGITIEEARARVSFLEDMREHVEAMPDPPPTLGGPYMDWPIDLPTNEESVRAPDFHLSAKMAQDLGRDTTYLGADAWAFWGPRDIWGIRIDPHVDAQRQLVIDEINDEATVIACVPSRILVWSRPGESAWSIGVAAKITGFRRADVVREGDWAELKDGAAPISRPIDGTMLARWDLESRELLLPRDSGRPLPAEIAHMYEFGARFYTAMALNFVLLLNNRDCVRTRIAHPTDEMNRQQRRAWERENGPACEEWQVRVKPRVEDEIGRLVRESAEGENVEHKLPGRHAVRGHLRRTRSGKIVQVRSFEKCKDRPWAHRLRQDAPEYDAWSLEERP